MKISYTNKNSSTNNRKHKSDRLQPRLDEFMARSETYMRITWEESDGYKSAASLYTSYRNAIRRSGYAIKIWKDRDQVWFEKIIKPKSP